jgi:hypothetical protein
MKKYHYTYKIINIKNKKSYIGVRSTNNIPSDDLGIKYFSSSSNLEFMQDQLENPQDYKYEILKLFVNRDLALAHEIELHEKYDVAKNDLFYNKAKQTSDKFDTSGITFNLSDEAKLKISNANKGRKFTKEHIENIGKSSLGRKHTEEIKKNISLKNTGANNGMYGKKHAEDSIKKMSESSKNPSRETRKKMSENHADVNGHKNPMYGKKHTIESKQKMSKPKTEEHRRKLSEAAKKRHSKDK